MLAQVTVSSSYKSITISFDESIADLLIVNFLLDHQGEDNAKIHTW